MDTGTSHNYQHLKPRDLVFFKGFVKWRNIDILLSNAQIFFACAIHVYYFERQRTAT
jgi:hypothetical protein